jgi:hypothetical protein
VGSPPSSQIPLRLLPVHKTPPWTRSLRHESEQITVSEMMRGRQSVSSHCVPSSHANDAAPVAGSWPVGCEFTPPSEQNFENWHGLAVLQAWSAGGDGGGLRGAGGGGCGKGV